MPPSPARTTFPRRHKLWVDGGGIMSQTRTIGILLNNHIVRAVLAGRPVHERPALYVKAARRLGLRPVLLGVTSAAAARAKVRGYVRVGKRWRPYVGPLPRVIHNRALAVTPAERRALRRLAGRRGILLFNPLVARDKWVVWRRLARDRTLRAHLPLTRPLTRDGVGDVLALVRKRGAVVLKPRHGAVGDGVFLLRRSGRHGGGFHCITDRGARRRLRAAAARRLLASLAARRRYLVQDHVDVVTYRGRRFDLRVPVQRDGSGRWQVVGMAVKRALRHPFLTNLGRGGKAHPGERVLRAVFGPAQAQAVTARIEALARQAAARLPQRRGLLADLGLDVGVDAQGKPWLFEVNFRDLRWSLRAAGQTAAFERLYANPMAYGGRLLARAARS